MLQEVLNDSKFSEIMREHIAQVVSLLLEKGVHFSILTNVNEIEFDPPLPEDIRSTFKPITMFVLAGYTFESCTIGEESLGFEAGFGPDNFGSYVNIPILSVLQIVINETPILINLAINNEKKSKGESDGVQRSMDALLSNPENEKLLKK